VTDVILTDSGDLPRSPSHGNPNQVLEQSIRIALNKGRGENPTDSGDGLPFLQWSQQKPVRVDTIAEQIRQEILDIPQVERIIELTAEHIPAERKVQVEGRLFAEPLPDAGVPFQADISREPNDANYLQFNFADV